MSDEKHDDVQDAQDDASPADQNQGVLVNFFKKIEKAGNRLPDPLTLFVFLTIGVVLMSLLFDGTAANIVQRDGTTKAVEVKNLLSAAGVRWMFTSAVDNFIKFPPLGPVLAVMIGIGVAERTGYISMGLRVLVRSVPNSALTSTLVFAGVMSSMVADAGYVVLTPLGAVLFAGLGRHPIAGLAAAFAGVSGGFSANLFITGLDPLLSKLTANAARTIDPVYAATINPTCNYYFMLASVVLITVLGTLVTTKIVEPMLGEWNPEDGDGSKIESTEPTSREVRAFKISAAFMCLTAFFICLLVAPDFGPLLTKLKPGQPAVSKYNAFFGAIEILITILFIIPGVIYGVLMGKIKSDKDIAKIASGAMADMGAYIVLAFVAGQFIAYFNHTNLGSITAVNGAQLLNAIGLTGIPLLLAFVFVSALMNLFVGSASAKWAFMAPIFVPILMSSGLSAASVQAAYRVGDSITNIISPLMPYLPIIIIFAQKYDRKAGLGTLMSAMLPFSIAFGIGWTILLIVWFVLGIPLGPGADMLYNGAALLK